MIFRNYLQKETSTHKNFKGIVSRTVATLGASEGGARHEVVGGIGPKGRSSGDYTLKVFLLFCSSLS